MLAAGPLLPAHLLTPWLLGLGTATAVMLVLWAIQLRTRDATVIDVAWALLIGSIGALFAFEGDGAVLQRALAGGTAALWSLRLSVHLVRDRVLRGAGEDGRYRALRAWLGPRAALHFVWVYLLQALLAAVFTLPFLLLAQFRDAALHPLQWVGLAVAALGVAGESAADAQLARHRADPDNRGRTCRSGLWRYSRHPNYFCEWLVWCGFALLATPARHGELAWLCPALMFVLVRFVSGVPFAEQQALRSRGADYRRYIATTNAFFPAPPRDPASRRIPS